MRTGSLLAAMLLVALAACSGKKGAGTTGPAGGDGNGTAAGSGDGTGTGTAAGGAAEGASCLAASDCASGVCEGEGCGPDQPGTCVAASRACTKDLRPYCGCDGATFRTSGSCPGARFAFRGECEEGAPGEGTTAP